MKEKMNFTYFHKAVERFFIFAVISSFMFCALSFIRDFTVASNREFYVFYTYIAILITQIVSFVIIAVYFNQKSTVPNFIRFFILYMILIAVILFFTRQWVSFILTFIATAIQTILYFNVFAPFFEHDCFEIQCIAKNDSSLQKELFDYNMHLSASAIGYRSNRTLFVVLGVILSLFACICIASETKISLFTISLFLTYFVCAGVHFFLYAYYVREAAFASNGFANVFDFRFKTIGTCIIIFAICFAAGLLVSSNHSPLKLYYLLYFFKLFKGKDVADPVPVVPEPELSEYEKRLLEIRAIQDAMSESTKQRNDLFPIICGIFLVVFVAWFFLKPIVTKKLQTLLRNTDLKGVFKRFFVNIKSFFKNIFRLRLKHSPVMSEKSRYFMDEMEELLSKSKKSKEKRAELDRLTKVFVKLIDWGEEHDIEYAKNLAPAEYTALFKNPDADIAGLLFEQALYAKEPLTKDQENDFNKAVKAVCG